MMASITESESVSAGPPPPGQAAAVAFKLEYARE